MLSCLMAIPEKPALFKGGNRGEVDQGKGEVREGLREVEGGEAVVRL